MCVTGFSVPVSQSWVVWLLHAFITSQCLLPRFRLLVHATCGVCHLACPLEPVLEHTIPINLRCSKPMSLRYNSDWSMEVMGRAGVDVAAAARSAYVTYYYDSLAVSCG